jgi:hypothetical protein
MTAKPVPEHISDERLDKVIARLQFEFDGVRTNTAKDILLALTELQHRREAEAGLAPDQSAMKAAALAFYGEHGITAMSGTIPPQFERAITAFVAASPSSPASALDALRSIAVGKLTASDAAYVARTTLSALGEHP